MAATKTSPLEAVLRWRAELKDAALTPAEVEPLSLANGQAGWLAAWDLLDPVVLQRAVEPAGEPLPGLLLITARTVFTAGLEWTAVALARGTSVRWRPPSESPGVAARVQAAAARHDLPLEIARGPRPTPEDWPATTALVVTMGSDATVREVERGLPAGVRHLGFGHRFGLAYWQDPTSARLLAEDLALHDGRGCLSPAVVFTPQPAEAAIAALEEALRAIHERWPLGARSEEELLRTRQRAALAQVAGRRRAGPWGEIHRLPVGLASPVGLPRAVQLVTASSEEEAWRWAQAHARWLGTVASDGPLLQDWEALGPAVRRTPLGTMQRPPASRLHDGVDWWKALWARPPA